MNTSASVTSSSRHARNRRIGWTRFMVPHASAFWFARTIFLGALGTGALLGYLSWNHQQKLVDAMIASGYVEHPDLIENFARLSMTNSVVVLLASAVFVTIMACFLVHRIAGPVYRIQMHMKGVIDDGPVNELRLRENDQLTDVCDTYNQLLYKLDLIDAKPQDTPRS